MTRIDQALVDRGLCDSREKARRAILAGQVRVNQQTARKPSQAVRPEDTLAIAAPEKYVSRGGHKLEHGLRHFGLEVAGRTAVDLGASTGGFTDCLLQHGAARVYAVDVGRGQLAWKLRQDRRVVVLERTNARHLTRDKLTLELQRHGSSPHQLGSRVDEGGVTIRKAGSPEMNCGVPDFQLAPVDLVVADCAFISLRKILPPAVALLRPAGRILALIKPQFEAGKAEADRGAGVIRDPAVHDRVLRELEAFATHELPLRWQGVTESPLRGPAGNKEFLVLLEKTG